VFCVSTDSILQRFTGLKHKNATFTAEIRCFANREETEKREKKERKKEEIKLMTETYIVGLHICAYKSSAHKFLEILSLY
jgi:hypothetical protein